MGTIRLILATAVIIFHSSSIFGIQSVGGQIAVQAFYIISGFYMALILNEKYIGINNSYKLFISNRFLRIYPIYWIVFIITIIASIASNIYTNGNNAGALNAYIKYGNHFGVLSYVYLIVSNIVIFLQDAVFFLGIQIPEGNLFFTSNFKDTFPPLYTFYFVPQAWTIGIELTFYLIAPFLARRNLKVLLSLIFLSLMLRLILIHNGLFADPWSYRFFPTELVFFLLGIISYRFYSYLNKFNLNQYICKIIFIIILLMITFYDSINFPGKYFIFFFFFFSCLPFIFILTKGWKFDKYIGELSYPMYISHLLLLRVLNVLKIPLLGSFGLTLTILTILFSITLNVLITKRIEKLRQNRIHS